MTNEDLKKKKVRLQIYRNLLDIYLDDKKSDITIRGLCYAISKYLLKYHRYCISYTDIKQLFVELDLTYAGYIGTPGERPIRVKRLQDAIYQIEHPILYKIK